MKKSILWILLLLTLLVCIMLPVNAAENKEVAKGEQIAADAEKMTFPTDGSDYEAVCPYHGTKVTWVGLTPGGAMTLEADSHYYLTESVTNSKVRFTAPNNWKNYSCLHLNGKSITNSANNVFVGKNGQLHVMGSGEVKGGATGENVGATVSISCGGSYGAINLYGGTYSKYDSTSDSNVTLIGYNGGMLNIYSGATVISGTGGSAVYMRSNMAYVKATFSLYGGTIDATDGTEPAIDTEAVAEDQTLKMTVNMYAGTVKNGSADYGGNVMIRNKVTFNMYGGTIEGGSVSGSGGNIAIYGGGTMNMSGGTVTGGTANTNGGNIYLTNYVTDTDKALAVLNMSGGTITSGTAVNGGNVCLYNQTAMHMTGGIVEKGTATQTGGNIGTKLSGTATRAQYAQLSFENAIIREGVTTTSGNSYGGGNLSIRKGDLTIKEGTRILDGHTAARGGNVQLIRGTAIMTGGTISGGIADQTTGYDELHLEGNSTTDPSILYMLGGKIEGQETASGTVRINAYSLLYLGGNATITDKNPENYEVRIYSSGKMLVCDGWSGSASAYFSDNWTVGTTAATDKLQVVKLDADRNETPGGSYTGKLTHSTTGALILSKGDGTAQVGGVALVDAKGNAVLTSDPINQWATGKYSYACLCSDYTLTGNVGGLVVDLSGFDLSLSGSGTVQVFDSSADGLAIPEGTVTTSGTQIAADVTAPNGNRYIALEQEGVYTLHQLEMKIFAVSLRPSDAGIYYRASYNCDPILAEAVESYGVALSLDCMPGEALMQEESTCYTVASHPFKSGTVATSGAVFGILKEQREAAVNGQYAQMKIYANPYIKLKGMVLVGDKKNAGKTTEDPAFDGIAMSLFDVLRTLDCGYHTLEIPSRYTLDSFCESWKESLQTLAFGNVGTADRAVDNSSLTFIPGTTQAECPVCKKTVTWTPYSQSADTETRIGKPAAGSHYYLTEDILYTGSEAAFFTSPAKDTTACIHLNGHNLTATANRVVYMVGNAGTLNIMGEGNVSGNMSAVGATLYVSTSNAAGTLKLYGGTYVKAEGRDSALSAIINGGSIYIYEGAWLKNNGSSFAIYMDVGKYTDASVKMYGGKATGGAITAAETTDAYSRSFLISGNAYLEDLNLKDPDIRLTVSGSPVIDRLRIKAGTKLIPETLVGNAKLMICANSVFTDPLEDPESFLPYVKPWKSPDAIAVNSDGALYYKTNYEHYMTPYERDVRAEAIADSQIHYYFMAVKDMIVTPVNNLGAVSKWGDCCLVVFPDGTTMLIDAGQAVQEPVIAGSLRRMGITSLDYLVITHPHSDHVGNVFSSSSTFLDDFSVGHVYYDDGKYPDNSLVGLVESSCGARGISCSTLKRGDVLTVSGVTLTVLWPNAGLTEAELAAEDAENKNSMVIRFDYGEHSALFTADIYTATETKLRELYTNGELDADLMKVPHHGIGQSSLAFIQSVSPEIAVSTGYHEISTDITSRYDAEDVLLLEDRYHGYIHISSGTDGVMTVETE